MPDLTAKYVYRDRVSDGIASSALYEPEKPLIRDLLTSYETRLAGLENTVSAPAKRPRNIANGLGSPESESASAQARTRSVHVNRGGDLTELETVVWPNFMAQASSSGEIGPGGTVTIEACLHNSRGGVTRLKFSGVNQGVMPDNSRLKTDGPFPIVGGLMDGETFAFEVFRTGANGLPRTAKHGNPGLGTKWLSGSSVDSDVTTSAYSGNANSFYYGPSAIVARTSRVSGAGYGDSRMRGDLAVDFDGWPSLDTGVIAPSLGDVMAFANYGRNSDRLEYFAANAANRLAEMEYHDFAVLQHAVNDIRNMSSPYTNIEPFKAHLRAICANAVFRNKKIFLATVEGYFGDIGSPSPDQWSTYAGQGAPVTEGARLAWNAWLRTQVGVIPNVVGVLDVAAALDYWIPLTADKGKWPTFNGIPFYACRDGLHGEPTAWSLIRNSGLILPATVLA
jgi:hypothetical protein